MRGDHGAPRPPGRGALVRPFPTLSWRANAGALAAGAAAVGLLSALYKHLDVLVSGGTRSFAVPLLDELTGAAGVVLLAPLVVGAARRWPLLATGGWRWLPIHLAGLFAFAAVATTWMWVSRSALSPLLGLGTYDYGDMPLRYLMELPKQAVIFGLILVMTTLFDRHEKAREHELRLSRAEAALARSELGALHAQLRPHFLFNALNTVSSVMYEDPARADRMIGSLSELLRWSLSASSAGIVPLQAELGATRTYLELMEARMGPRLRSDVFVEPGSESALVPALVLQPLIENAVTHGLPNPPAVAHIQVQVVCDGGDLVLRVLDNGTGPVTSGKAIGGVGLGNTAARLRALYGDVARLRLFAAASGGAVAEVRLPFSAAPPEQLPQETGWTQSV
jgi:two-component system, LytTR family, sensor kinase